MVLAEEVDFIGVSFIPQMGQLPGSSLMMSGCIPQE
jgi:hypothetical protein